MTKRSRLAIIGSGASAIFILKHLLDNISTLRGAVARVSIHEQRAELGPGMPYSRQTTDKHNICNISSAEIPALSQSLVDWLKSLSDPELRSHGLHRSDIDADEMYRRTTLGDYFQAQYRAVTDGLRAAGIFVDDHVNNAVVDIVDSSSAETVKLHLANGDLAIADRVVIATGHSFSEPDSPDSGYFASPWPIHKLLPDDGEIYDFEIGILGASLSAFDVVSSLSHRHGAFRNSGSELVFDPKPGTDAFRLVLYSAEGWLPHLQYEQEEPFREIYRHVEREAMLAMRDADGFLSLDDYFDRVCRPALVIAFAKDKRDDIVGRLEQDRWGIEEFVERLGDEHSGDDPFSVMRNEMPAADRSLRRGIPIHWKEALDDLMFTLNFHFDWLPAEDHLRYRKIVVPFLMNVIAAMPLCSARTLLALHDAGKLNLISGRVQVKEKRSGETLVELDSDGKKTLHAYKMFIDCSGQGSLDVDDFPFPTLTQSGTIAEAVGRFRRREAIDELDDSGSKQVVERGGLPAYRLGGIAIDGYYRVIDCEGKSNPRIYDVAFPHATGVRPYSYGLQACDTTAAIVVDSWCEETTRNAAPPSGDSAVTQTYDDLPVTS